MQTNRFIIPIFLGLITWGTAWLKTFTPKPVLLVPDKRPGYSNWTATREAVYTFAGEFAQTLVQGCDRFEDTGLEIGFSPFCNYLQPLISFRLLVASLN